jgi:hypothetical protein
MNIKDYVFEGHWLLLSEHQPSNAQRVLLTNGDTIVIGSLTIQDDVIHWLFDRSGMDDYQPVAWMELPNLSPLKKHEKTVEKTNLET